MSQVPVLAAIEQSQKRQLPPFRVGDTVKVHFRVHEGDKERVQVFQGVVIRHANKGVGATFAVRKTSYGVGVERIFPANSPRIEKVEVTAQGHTRRSRLFFLRNVSGKKSKLRKRQRHFQSAVASSKNASSAQQTSESNNES